MVVDLSTARGLAGTFFHVWQVRIPPGNCEERAAEAIAECHRVGSLDGFFGGRFRQTGVSQSHPTR